MMLRRKPESGESVRRKRVAKTGEKSGDSFGARTVTEPETITRRAVRAGFAPGPERALQGPLPGRLGFS
jgi:hypothetical protein